MGTIYVNGDRYPGPGVSPKPPDILLSKFDFTKDTDYLIDEVNPELSVSITSSIVHDSNGLNFPNVNGQYIKIPNYQLIWNHFNKMYCEIDIGNMNLDSSLNVNRRFLMNSNSTNGFVYRGGSSYNYWSIYNGSWITPGAVDTNINTFANSTVKILCTNGSLQIYKNNNLFFEVPNFSVANPESTVFYIGVNSNNSINNITIKGIRLYVKQ